MQVFYIESENTKVVDIAGHIKTHIHVEVENDIHKFAISSKPLKRKFMFFRVCNYILEIVDSCKKAGQKLLLYVDKNQIKEYSEYMTPLNTICKSLSICFMQGEEAFMDFYKNVNKKTGESKDRKNKINCLCNKQLKNPNISQFTKLLLKKGIHKLDGKLNTLEVKLGLYTT